MLYEKARNPMQICVEVNPYSLQRMLTYALLRRTLLQAVHDKGDRDLDSTISLLTDMLAEVSKVDAACAVLRNDSESIFDDDTPDDQLGLWGMPGQ